MEPITQEVKQEVGQYLMEVEKIQVLEITNQNEFEISEAGLKNVRAKYKEIETRRKKITDPLDLAKKETMDLFRKPLMLLDALEVKINDGRKIWLNKKEQERLALERELREKAEKEAREKQEALLREAAKTKDKEKAKELKQEAKAVTVAPAPVVQSQAVMGDKRVNRKTWKLIIDDKAAIPEKYKLVNESLLLAERRATPEAQELKVKGVTFKYEY